MLQAVSDETFHTEVVQSSLPVLVDFWAERCAPCVAMNPLLDEISQELDGRMKFVKVHGDENFNTTTRYGVRSLPTLLVFKNGEPVDMKVGGGSPKVALLKWLEQHAA